MAKNDQKIGWIGMGRMGSPMAERLLKAGYDVSIWNRTRSKAEPLTAKGGKVVDKLADLAGVDVLFSIVSTGTQLKELGGDFIAAPVSGNAKVIKAGRLSAVISGTESACKTVMPMMEAIAPQGVSYVGQDELARICKIAHN